MSELETRTVEQLPPLAAVDDSDQVVVQPLGGTMSRVSVEKLVDRIITDIEAGGPIERGRPGAPQIISNFSDGIYWPEDEAASFNGVGTPRFRNHLITGEPQGLLVEEAATQLCYGTDFAGANAGTGTLPTHWSTLFAVAGVSAITTAITADYIEIQINGTPATTGAFGLLFNGSSAGLVIGDKVTGSFDIQSVLPGTHTGVVSTQIGIYEINPAQTAVQVSVKRIWPEADRRFPVCVTRTLTTYPGDVRHCFILNVTAGVVVSAKFRIARVQRVKGAFVSSYVHNTTAAPLVRVADQPVADGSLAALFPGQNWTIDCTFTPDRQSTGTVWLAASNSVAQGIQLVLLDGRVTLIAYAPGKPDMTLNVGVALPWFANSLRVCAGPTWLSASLNGKPPAVGDFVPPTLMEVFQYGWSGAGYLNGTIGYFAAYESANRVLRSETPDNTGYDDFDREDGELGQPWINNLREVSRRDAIGTADPALTKMQIIEKKVAVGISGFASAVDYAAFDLRQPVRVFIARVSYGTGAYPYDAVLALIGNPRGRRQVTDITFGSLHMIWSGVDTQFAYFDADGSATYHVPRVIPHYASIKDGNEHSVGFMVNGDALVVLNVDGSLDRIVDPGFAEANGQYAKFEHFAVDGGGASIANVRPLYFHAVGASSLL